jgi:hypothetical protein
MCHMLKIVFTFSTHSFIIEASRDTPRSDANKNLTKKNEVEEDFLDERRPAGEVEEGASEDDNDNFFNEGPQHLFEEFLIEKGLLSILKFNKPLKRKLVAMTI